VSSFDAVSRRVLTSLVAMGNFGNGSPVPGMMGMGDSSNGQMDKRGGMQQNIPTGPGHHNVRGGFRGRGRGGMSVRGRGGTNGEYSGNNLVQHLILFRQLCHLVLEVPFQTRPRDRKLAVIAMQSPKHKSLGWITEEGTLTRSQRRNRPRMPQQGPLFPRDKN
jgi:hypothetical protein